MIKSILYNRMGSEEWDRIANNDAEMKGEMVWCKGRLGSVLYVSLCMCVVFRLYLPSEESVAEL